MDNHKQSTEYLARRNALGAANVAATVCRWLINNLDQDSNVREWRSWLGLITTSNNNQFFANLKTRVTAILEKTTYAWDFGSTTIPFSFVFLRSNAVLLKVGRLRVLFGANHDPQQNHNPIVQFYVTSRQRGPSQPLLFDG